MRPEQDPTRLVHASRGAAAAAVALLIAAGVAACTTGSGGPTDSASVPLSTPAGLPTTPADTPDAITTLPGTQSAPGPSLTAPEVIADPHVAQHHMLVEMDRSDDGPDPVLVPGNPVKLSKVAEGPETRVPWLGEHTDEVLVAELGLSEERLAELRAAGVIG